MILNTTFVLHEPLLPDFLTWLKTTYLPSAEAEGIFGTPVVARVNGSIDPGTVSIAVQLTTAHPEAASKWHDTEAALLRNRLHSHWGDRCLFFTTTLETIEL